MAETIKLTNRDLQKLNEGIVALDGIADASGGVTRFDLGVDLSWNVAKIRTIVERANEAFNRAKKSLAAQNGVVERQRVTAENAPAVAKYIDDVEALLDKEVELTGILLLDRSVLQKAGVKTPGIYSNLMLIIADK